MTHRFDLNLDKFGKLSYLETLLYWDRDLAMSYKDEGGNLYYVYLQPKQEPIERWILLPVSKKTLSKIERLKLEMPDWAELLNRDETKVYSFDDPEAFGASPSAVVEWSREKKSEYAASLLD